jgi:hypothetical protein
MQPIMSCQGNSLNVAVVVGCGGLSKAGLQETWAGQQARKLKQRGSKTIGAYDVASSQTQLFH